MSTSTASGDIYAVNLPGGSCFLGFTMQSVMVAMRDGVKLHTTLYFPPHTPEQRFHARLMRSPYFRRDYLPLPDKVANTDKTARVFQACRGTAFSEGVFDPADPETEQRDAEDTLAWFLQQPWFAGRCVMDGGSYVGKTQWDAAFSASPVLVGIAPHVAALHGCSTPCVPGGGAVLQFPVNWCITMYHRNRFGYAAVPDYAAQRLFDHLPVRECDRAAGYPVIPAWRKFAKLAAKPGAILRRDQARFSRVKVPALISGGWFDPFVWEAIHSFHQMKKFAATELARQATRLYLGPWQHSGLEQPELFGQANNLNKLNRLRQEFLAGLLDDPGRDPLPELAQVTYFVTGLNRWRTAEVWPPAEARDKKFYFTRERTLATEKPAEEQALLSYRTDPANPFPNYSVQGADDRAKLENRPDVLCFTTTPFARRLTVAGHIRAHLELHTDAPDADVFVTVTDVYPDGRSLKLCQGMVRARFRKSLNRSRLLGPRGGDWNCDITCSPIANAFLKGHALRVEIAGTEYPRYERNAHTGATPFEAAELKAATTRFFCGALRGSKLIIPVVR